MACLDLVTELYCWCAYLEFILGRRDSPSSFNYVNNLQIFKHKHLLSKYNCATHIASVLLSFRFAPAHPAASKAPNWAISKNIITTLVSINNTLSYLYAVHSLFVSILISIPTQKSSIKIALVSHLVYTPPRPSPLRPLPIIIVSITSLGTSCGCASPYR